MSVNDGHGYLSPYLHGIFTITMIHSLPGKQEQCLEVCPAIHTSGQQVALRGLVPPIHLRVGQR